MGYKATVLTRTPHYDYTQRYNHKLDKINHEKNLSETKKTQTKIEDFYDSKRTKVQTNHHLERKLQSQRELETLHQYDILDNRHSYYNYKYQFYVGTLFDCYI